MKPEGATPEIETMNKFLVSWSVHGLFIQRPPKPQQPLSNQDALLLAAWLVTMADPQSQQFQRVLTAVQST